MVLNSGQSADKFLEAARHWQLDKLYADLTSVKGRSLTRSEKQYLRGLLCSYSPTEIAEQTHVTSGTVRHALSDSIYRYIEDLLMSQAKQTTKIKHWSRVARLLERAGYKINALPQESSDLHLSNSFTEEMRTQDTGIPAHSWDICPDAVPFYGRSEELATLTQWVLEEECRLIAVSGLGGIGKTTLVAKLAKQVQDRFEYVIWRSLNSAPSIATLLADLLGVLCKRSEFDETNDLQTLISNVFKLLARYRCLLVLEDVHSILSSGKLVGEYLADYEAYGEFFRRMGCSLHQSCAIVTGWDKLREVARLEGQEQPVRSLQLQGLSIPAATEILHAKGLASDDLDELISLYRGNPLALKIVATTIQDLFGGSVRSFLDQNTLFLGDFGHLLYQQFERLADLEKQVMSWLAEQDKAVSLVDLKQGLDVAKPWSELLQVLESLSRRSLIEKTKVEGGLRLNLQPAVKRYAIAQLSPK